MLLHGINRRIYFAPDAEGAGAGGGAGAGAGGNNAGGAPAFATTLPENLRSHAAFKDVKDVGDLATRYVGAVTPKPFAETLPEDIRGNVSFKDMKGVDDLAKSYLGQAKLLGVPKDQLLVMPKDAADKEGWNAIYSKIGRPESADKYVPPKLALPEGVTLKEDEQKAFAAAAHELGISQRQYEGLMAWEANRVVTGRQGAAAESKKADEQAVGALNTEWGAAYEQKSNLAISAVQHFSADLKLGDALENELVKNMKAFPAISKVFAHLGAQLQEDGLLGKGGGGGGALSPGEAEQQINAKRADPQFAARLQHSNKQIREAAAAELLPFYEAIAAAKKSAGA